MMRSIQSRLEDTQPTWPLRVEDLSVGFQLDNGFLPAIRNLSFEVNARETLAIVGESGCGKSITALSLLRLVPKPGKIEADGIFIEGQDILRASESALRAMRGSRIAMIFQEPMTALNPVMTIGDQIAEAILEHESIPRKDARARAVGLLKKVKIPDADRRYHEYPHRLSGGMRQRVMIAIALACNPAVLIADEPTTALDVTVQAEILQLINDLKNELGMAVVLITHDLGVVYQYSDRVLVMYAGRQIEYRKTEDVFSVPSHPYTLGLIGARPQKGTVASAGRLVEIAGRVPSLFEMPDGCPFEPRCRLSIDICKGVMPALAEISPGDTRDVVACHRWKDVVQESQLQ